MLIGIVAVVLGDQAEARRELAELTGRSTGPVTIAAFSSGICSSRSSPPSPAYAGKLVDWAKQHLNLAVKPVSRPKDASGFVVLPRRWVVERSLAWMMHARRHARDYERLIQHSETLITWAAITLMTRRLARKGATPSWPRKPTSATSA